MGKDHPVAWYRSTGEGMAMYTSIGHDATAWKQPGFIALLETAIKNANPNRRSPLSKRYKLRKPCGFHH